MQRNPDGHPSGSTAAGRQAVRAHVWVRGHVQGVGFRFFVQRQALHLGLVGFVRNLRDRRVEVVVEGPADTVEALIAAVRRGPAGASVSDVDLVWEALHHDASFVIRADDRA